MSSGTKLSVPTFFRGFFLLASLFPLTVRAHQEGNTGWWINLSQYGFSVLTDVMNVHPAVNLENGRRARCDARAQQRKTSGRDRPGGRRRFAQAFKGIEEIRRAVQNGAPERAPEILRRTIAAFSAAPPAAPLPPSDLAVYDGAPVMNALGLPIGEVEGADGDQLELNLRKQDVLGFIELGGTRLRVPADRLLFGKKKKIGPTMVWLPVFEQEPEQIRRALFP